MKNPGNLKLYNSLTDTLEDFKPIRSGLASLYVCGPTVYNDPHIGNMRPLVVFSLLKKTLIHLGYEVTLVSNYTDVDDKIILKASNEGVSEEVISNRYIAAYENVLTELHLPRPDIQPRVSNYIPQIIAYIETLIANGAAYEKNGNVYFRVQYCDDYGCLSNIKIDEIEVGARIEENREKENPVDFVIWKKTEVGLRWPSPWSEGRPGWHTECSVMINSLFPEGLIDIHGGGMDLKFPHHENEIAQSEAHNHNHLAHYWIHNGFVNVKGDKMSKSLGNVLLAKDAINEYGGEVVKYVLLATHYRLPINLTSEVFANAKIELDKIHAVLNSLSVKIQLNGGERRMKKTSRLMDFIRELCDDLNISNAMTVLFEIVKETNLLLRNPKTSIKDLEEYYATIISIFDILCLNSETIEITEEDRTLYLEYLKAREEKDFITSDTLRKELLSRKIPL